MRRRACRMLSRPPPIMTIVIPEAMIPLIATCRSPRVSTTERRPWPPGAVVVQPRRSSDAEGLRRRQPRRCCACRRLQHRSVRRSGCHCRSKQGAEQDRHVTFHHSFALPSRWLSIRGRASPIRIETSSLPRRVFIMMQPRSAIFTKCSRSSRSPFSAAM